MSQTYKLTKNIKIGLITFVGFYAIIILYFLMLFIMAAILTNSNQVIALFFVPFAMVAVCEMAFYVFIKTLDLCVKINNKPDMNKIKLPPFPNMNLFRSSIASINKNLFKKTYLEYSDPKPIMYPVFLDDDDMIFKNGFLIREYLVKDTFEVNKFSKQYLYLDENSQQFISKTLFANKNI